MTTDKDTEALIESLRWSYENWALGSKGPPILLEAATTLRAQQDRIRELEAERDVARISRAGWKRISEEQTGRAETAEAKLAEAMEVIKPFASVRYMGANAFNRADLSDNDFRAARTLMQKMEGGDA